MKITPIDIRKHSFKKRLRGCDPKAVESFLFLVAEEFERLVNERENLREKCTHLESQLSGFDEREKILKRTLYTAQKASDDQKENARKEAELIRKEAELRAEQIVEAAHARALEVQKDIQELQMARQRALAAIEATLEEHRRLLDAKRVKAKQDGKVKTFVK
ncbi:MAG: DivIVA domain-containing protein [Acidobacteriota bacterium]|nr:MAG: DivIVA domain-containing protein [Acidobacteriota bacterium]